MELVKKILKVITTIVPRTSVYINKQRGGYIVEVRRTWLGREVTVEIAAKDAARTEMSLLDLL
jgi:hypothetical protein